MRKHTYHPRRRSYDKVNAETDLKARLIIFGGSVGLASLFCRDAQPGEPCYDMTRQVLNDQGKDLLIAMLKVMFA